MFSKKMILIDLLLTAYLWFLTIISVIVTAPICFLCYPFVSQKTLSRIYEKVPSLVVLSGMTWTGIWDIHVIDNRKNKTWDREYVIVANHLSFIDSIVIAESIPLKKKFMIGEIFTKIPIFGTLSRLAGHVTANLHNPELNRSAVPRAVETINRDNCSFAIFPEGKRELTPYQFEPFKTGAYRIAKATGLDILPVTLSGTYEAMRFWGIVSPATITVWIDEPFGVYHSDFDQYIQKTKNIITSHL